VVLRRGKKTVACEICVRNTAEYEIHNAHKCLKAGFQQIIVICPNQRKLTNLQQAIKQSVTQEEQTYFSFRTPKEIQKDIGDWAAADPEGGREEKSKQQKQNQSFDTKLSIEERKVEEAIMRKKLSEKMKENKQKKKGSDGVV
jgi:tRNA threonylcarbamoyladenosine modification (KEOPS) complex Cgi121 subunit